MKNEHDDCEPMNTLPTDGFLADDEIDERRAPDSSLHPIVSIIVVARNKAEHLENALQSALSQSIRDVEVVIIDDGSDDGSLDIAKRYSKRDSRVVVLARKNAGVSAARNQGLTVARGHYVAFLDPDDWYPDVNVLRDLVGSAERFNLPIAGGNAECFVKGTQVGELPFKELGYRFESDGVVEYSTYQLDTGLGCFIFRQSFLVENGVLFPPYRRYQGPPFLVRALSISGHFVASSRPAYVHRVATTTNLPAEYTVDVLHGMVDVLKIAAELELHDLISQTVRRFNSPHIQSALAAVLESNDQRVLPLLETMSRLAVTAGGIWVEGAYPSASSDPSAVESDLTVDVSVVIPVYNASAWLHECLLSVLGQTGVRLEVVCIDDGSTDDSMRLLNEYQALDSRIRIVQQENGGLSVARNAGLSVARGRYVCFLDSDDYYRIDALEQLVKRSDDYELDVLQFDAVPFAAPGVSEQSWRQYSKYYQRSVERPDVATGAQLIAAQIVSKDYKPSACLYLIRASHLTENQIRFVPRITHEDNPFTFAVFLNADRAAQTAVGIYARRVRPGSIMTSASADASMLGYFVSYLEMSSEAARHDFAPEVNRVLGNQLFQIFNNVSTRFATAGATGIDALRSLVSTPDGEVAFATLTSIRLHAQKVAAATKK